MNGPTEIRARAEPYADAIGIFIQQGKSAARQIVMETMAEGEFRTPLVRLGIHEAQMLIDDLWSAGLRPTAGKQSEGMVSATEAHLRDMRAIAFAKLNIGQPGKPA